MSSDRERGSALHVSKWAGVVMPKSTRPKNGAVIVTTVHPDAWSLALILAGRDIKRLVNRTANSVTVANNPGQFVNSPHPLGGESHG